MSTNYQQFRDLARELATAGETALAQWMNMTVALGGPHVAEEISQGLAERLPNVGNLPNHLKIKLRNIAADSADVA